MTNNNDQSSGTKGCGIIAILTIITSIITIAVFGLIDLPQILKVLNISEFNNLMTPVSEITSDDFTAPDTNQLSTTSSLVYVNDYVIPGNTNQGIVISIIKSGNYRLEYKSGAYKTNPVDDNSWLTAIYVFQGTNPAWAGRLLSKADANIFADHGLIGSQSEATSLASGDYTQAYFEEGDFLTLLGADFSDSYSDNVGEVTISLFEVK
ncbi:MAG: hypothetical protein FP831_11235 [Anaerolineae bacterium]|nr:hypothetical protein [Anaerolineae bacterium]